MSSSNEKGGRLQGPAINAQDAVDQEALDWVIRMAEPDADWDAFTTWLEVNHVHTERYDHAASALRDVETRLAGAASEAPSNAVMFSLKPVTSQNASTRSVSRRGSMRLLAAAVAATVAGAIGLVVWTEMPRPYEIETKAGEQRIVQVGEGTSLVLAGASRVQLDRSDPRVAAVAEGEVLFRVRHDPDHPFSVTVSDLQLVDLGTVFDVKAMEGRTRVSVAEGAVMVDPEGAGMRLDPGQAVVAQDGTLDRRTVEPSEVGSWREGRLAFDDAPLSEVASDLSRELGRRIVVAPSIARRTFRGTLELGTLRDSPALLGELLGVRIRQRDGSWTLEPAR